jgi:hypothetical protein
VLWIQVPRGSRRRSPLARSPTRSTLLKLATLQKIIVANQDTLSNFCSRIYTSQCNCCGTILKFLCNWGNKDVFFLKNVTLPHLAVLHENFKASQWSFIILRESW